MHTNYKLLVLLLTFSFLGFSQNVIIYQPGPGANNGNDQGGYNGGKDTYTYQDLPSANHADIPNIVSLPVSNCNSTHAEILIQFDLGELPADVDSVFVGFTHNDHTVACYSNCEADWYFAAIKNTWSETTANYSNLPAVDTAFYGPINIKFPNSFGKREYNITDMYRKWRFGLVTNNGFKIYSPNVGCNNAAVMFNIQSSDDTAVNKRPYLKLYYRDPSGIKSLPLSVTVSPNPANDLVTLHLNAIQEKHVNVTITDIYGKTLLTFNEPEQAKNNTFQFSINQLSAGTYFVNVKTTTGLATTKLNVYR
jgi:hypothetical protein